MKKEEIIELWKLSRDVYPLKYGFSKIDSPRYIFDEDVLPTISLSSNPGSVTCYQSHSKRSAWLYQPCKIRNEYYPGIEYKGIGYNGGGITAINHIPWGGIEKQRAVEEHKFSKMANNAGILCQQPIACYDYGNLNNILLAVVVRTFKSPLRLSNFYLRDKLFKQYLDIRNLNEESYCIDLAITIGKSVRRMFEINLYHGSMEINNITSEGEIADFEPTYGGTWEGLMVNSEPRFRILALKRLFSIFDIFLPHRKETFIQHFSMQLLNKEVSISNSDPCIQIIEEYIGRKLDEEERFIEFPSMEGLKDIVEELKIKFKNSKSQRDKEQLEFIIKRLS